MSSQQERAVMDVARWMSGRSGDQVYRLFGNAGTGKTTLLRRLVSEADRPWLFAAFTGKAALVMRQKGCHGARTIHSLIYRPEEVKASVQSSRKRGSAAQDAGHREVRFRLWAESPLRDAEGVVVDECSMVDADLARDLLSFGKKVLVCGDPGQLPPVDGPGFFMEADPDTMLTEVHRQAADSGIIDLATFIREGGSPAAWDGDRFTDCRVLSRSQLESQEIWSQVIDADQVIVGRNRTRQDYNRMYRRMLRIASDFPVRGDKVVCLRNERELGLLNGSTWAVLSADVSRDCKRVVMQVQDDDGIQASPGEVTAWMAPFLGRELDPATRMVHSEFDFGYCLTTHKAQGSQWDKVVLFDESDAFREDRARWLYTGVTRAARDLTVLIP